MYMPSTISESMGRIVIGVDASGSCFDALEPFLSEKLMSLHHDKHHAAYVNALNGLLPEDDSRSLEAVIADAGPGKVFNNAAQAWNHAFFWECMAPASAGPASARPSIIVAPNRRRPSLRRMICFPCVQRVSPRFDSLQAKLSRYCQQ